MTMCLKLPQLKAVCPPPFLHSSGGWASPERELCGFGWFALGAVSQPQGFLRLDGWKGSLEMQPIGGLVLCPMCLEWWRVCWGSVFPLIGFHLPG